MHFSFFVFLHMHCVDHWDCIIDESLKAESYTYFVDQVTNVIRLIDQKAAEEKFKPRPK